LSVYLGATQTNKQTNKKVNSFSHCCVSIVLIIFSETSPRGFRGDGRQNFFNFKNFFIEVIKAQISSKKVDYGHRHKNLLTKQYYFGPHLATALTWPRPTPWSKPLTHTLVKTLAS
jgi:hypothetical protein